MAVVTVSAKCSDMFAMSMGDLDYDGYVPQGSLGGGDYIEMQIDNETGQILDWKPLNEEDFNPDED